MRVKEAMERRRDTGDSKRIRMILLFMTFTGVISGDPSLSSTIRAGDDVTLSCENVIEGYRNCSSTTWIYNKPGRAAEEVVVHGQVRNSRSDRLSLAGNCSLVLKNVSPEEAGLYTCRQYERVEGPQSGSDARVDLYVVTLTEQADQNKVTLTCSVSTYDGCRHDVKWLFKSVHVEQDHPDIKTSSPSSCSAVVTLPTSHYLSTSSLKFFKCEVKTGNKKQLFTFHPTDKTTTPSTSPPIESGSGGNSKDSVSGMTWVFVGVGVGVASVLLIIGLTLIILKRNQVSQQKTPKGSSVGTTSDPEAAPSAPERVQVEAEAGVAYACISYTKNSSRSSSEVKNDDGDVTYSMVKAPPTDPNSLYASVVKTPK